MNKKQKFFAAVIFISTFAIILLVIYAIGRNPMGLVSLEPEVKITNQPYNYTSIGELWNVPIYEEFNEEYGIEYSQNLQDNIIENMKDQVEDAGEHTAEMERCLKATGQFGGHSSPRLPCYAELATFEYYANHRGVDQSELDEMEPSELGPTASEECWIFVINWGMEGEPLGHIKIYAISTKDFSILYYSTCG
jgi:hypothetical protein